MDIYKILKWAEKVEIKMAMLYARFSRTFGDDEEAAFIFRKMSYDEESHADLVQFELKLIMENRREFQDVDIHFDEISQVLARVEEVITSSASISVEDALRLSMEFEKGVAEIHTKKAITASNPNVVKLLRNLGQKDEEHYGFLREFAQKRGIMAEEFVPPDEPSVVQADEEMNEDGMVISIRMRK